MVRCGIALYGCSPVRRRPGRPGPAPRDVAGLLPRGRRRPSGRARARATAALWRAARGTRVAVVPVGYADGYARALVGTGRGAHGRAAGAGGGDHLDGPAHGGPRGRAAEERGGGGRAAGRPRAPSGSRRRSWRRCAGPSTTRWSAPWERASRGFTRGEPPGPMRGLLAPLGPLDRRRLGGGRRGARRAPRPPRGRPRRGGGRATPRRAAARSRGRTARARFLLSRGFGAWRVQGGDLGVPSTSRRSRAGHRRGPVAP